MAEKNAAQVYKQVETEQQKHKAFSNRVAFIFLAGIFGILAIFATIYTIFLRPRMLTKEGENINGNSITKIQMDEEHHSGMTEMEPNSSNMHNMIADGHDMSPIDISNAPKVNVNSRGNQLIEPLLVNGVKEFNLNTSVVQWSILPNITVGAYAYNRQVPGPLIRVNPGEQVQFKIKNDLPEATSIHWHGLIIPNSQDGVAGITQPPIQPGETFTYEYTVPATPGTYFYHSHAGGDRQQAVGLYGVLIIDDPNAVAEYDSEYIITLGEWRRAGGQTFPAMDFDGMLPNFFTINGKSYPATEEIKAQVGERILLRFIGTGEFIHPMHVHGGPFKIVASDGNPVPPTAQLQKDTVLVGPGERYDVIWTAKKPGKWLIHCHINHHTTNGSQQHGRGGLLLALNVT